MVVGGIGCSSRAVGYLDFDTVHTIHGRALAFATGIKMARPDFTVVVLHRRRRRRGHRGQSPHPRLPAQHRHHLHPVQQPDLRHDRRPALAPPWTIGNQATTAPFGQVEPPFDLCRLTEAAGASFVARGTAAASASWRSSSSRASSTRASRSSRPWCPVPRSTASAIRPAGVLAMLDDEKARSISARPRPTKLPPEELVGKIVTGVLHEDEDTPEFQGAYEDMASARTAGRRRADGGRSRRAAQRH